jgi:hypothetical protein
VGFHRRDSLLKKDLGRLQPNKLPKLFFQDYDSQQRSSGSDSFWKKNRFQEKLQKGKEAT